MLIIDLLLAAAFVTGIAKTRVITSQCQELLLIFVGGVLGMYALEHMGLDITAIVILIGTGLNVGVGMYVNYRRDEEPTYLAEKVR